MVKEYCDVCGSRKKLHYFPRDRAVALKWAEAVEWADEFMKRSATMSSTHSISICTKHFQDDCYFDANRTKLRPRIFPVSHDN